MTKSLRLSPHPLKDSDYDRITDEAALWLERQSEGALSAGDQELFEAWLGQDERHGGAYERLARLSVDALGMGHLRAFADADAPFPNWRTKLADGTRWMMRPAPLFGSALAAAACALMIWMAPDAIRAPPQYQTEIAEIAPLALPDGSVVTLGADSALDADFSNASRRQITLRSGQAFFEIAPNRARPFFVLAGDVAVRVVGTKFDVRRGADETTITVEEGHVEVSSEGRDRPLVLHAGDRAVIAERRLLSLTSAPAPLVAPAPQASIAPWREGRLSYEDTPLSEVVADLNRYYGPGVRLASSELGAVRVTTSFPTSEVEGFLADLNSALPVRAEKQADGGYRIAASDVRR